MAVSCSNRRGAVAVRLRSDRWDGGGCPGENLRLVHPVASVIAGDGEAGGVNVAALSHHEAEVFGGSDH
jgi:hypothetical protein